MQKRWWTSKVNWRLVGRICYYWMLDTIVEIQYKKLIKQKILFVVWNLRKKSSLLIIPVIPQNMCFCLIVPSLHPLTTCQNDMTWFVMQNKWDYFLHCIAFISIIRIIYINFKQTSTEIFRKWKFPSEFYLEITTDNNMICVLPDFFLYQPSFLNLHIEV